ncbi:hypothetical protein F5Y11DRAFT_311791 [Daldinia sp. FL1419]|nr:hypothetical protein F5Y11DRAFT_311791 [Daldinia sp. FL1419]
MARSWQLWLSPRPRRTDTPLGPRMLAVSDAALYEFLYDEDGNLTVKETHYAENQAARDGLSGPPLHIHLEQDEIFQVEQGTLAVIKNGKEYSITKDDEALEVPAGTLHRFWAKFPVREDVVFKVWLQPQTVEYGFDENWVRNILGYLRDCKIQGFEPSVFQLSLINLNSGIIFYTPSFWVPVWILRLIQYPMAYFVGKLLLGYRERYPEYNSKSHNFPHGAKKER